MKVLYLNCNYFTGIRGGWKSYLGLCYRYAFLRKKVSTKNINKLLQKIAQANPDIVCLTEIRSKHLKYFKKQFPHLIDTCKYEGTKWSKIPGFRKNRLAVLSKVKIKAEIGQFQQGMKRAFLKFSGEWGEGHFVHLSLGKRKRANQVEQLRSYVHDTAFFIGDFNTLTKQEQGVCPIFENVSLAKLSFPANKVSKAVDHCIGKICEDIQYFDSQISDHLGMIFYLAQPHQA